MRKSKRDFFKRYLQLLEWPFRRAYIRFPFMKNIILFAIIILILVYIDGNIMSCTVCLLGG